MNSIINRALAVLVRAQLSTDERGQTSAEYLGVLVLVAAVVAAVANTHIGETIAGAIGNKISAIAGS